MAKAIEIGGCVKKCFYFIWRDSFKCCAKLLGPRTFLVIKSAAVIFVQDSSMKATTAARIWGSTASVC